MKDALGNDIRIGETYAYTRRYSGVSETFVVEVLGEVEKEERLAKVSIIKRFVSKKEGDYETMEERPFKRSQRELHPTALIKISYNEETEEHW